MRLFLSGSAALLLCAALAMADGAAAQSTTPKLQLGPYEQALRWMEKGQCDKAHDVLLPDGEPNPGDELALADLGNCYLRAAKKMDDPDAAQRAREMGAGWILRAANAGLRDAEEDAVKLYLDDKIFMIDPYEAGKWYLLWQANHSQIQLGQLEFDAETLRRLNATVTSAEWAEAKARAIAWTKAAISEQAKRSSP